MISNKKPGKEKDRSGQDDTIGPEIEFEPPEDTFPDEEISFSAMFLRLERDRSLGHDESFY